jgi:4'-phosphopantetheinyl transferase
MNGPQHGATSRLRNTNPRRRLPLASGDDSDTTAVTSIHGAVERADVRLQKCLAYLTYANSDTPLSSLTRVNKLEKIRAFFFILCGLLQQVRLSWSFPAPVMRFLTSHEVLATSRIEALGELQIDVWPLLLESSGPAYDDSLLPLAERERAARFGSERGRSAFVCSRVLMRHVLAIYCDVSAGAVEFVAGHWGKPALAGHCRGSRHVSFNLSHSNGRALLAVARGRELGVDLEFVRPKTNALALARGYFCAGELEALLNAPEARLQQDFFRYWTAKEAVLKAQGTGLRVPLDCFRILFDADLQTASVETYDTGRVEAGWHVQMLDSEPGWCAAVAARGGEWTVKVAGAEQA